MAEVVRCTQSLLQCEVLLTANIVYNFDNNVRNSLEEIGQGINF